MIAGPLAWMRRRWDVAVDPADPIPFARVRTQINLKRLEFLGWIGIANSVAEAFAAVGLHLGPYLYLTFVNMAVDLAIIGAARWTLMKGSPRLQALLPPFTVTLMLLLFQLSIAMVAATGRLTSSYPLALLGIALLFVLPPKVFGTIMAGTFATFTAMVWHTGAPLVEQAITIRIAALAAVVATVAGALIHAARERDHEQKLAIHDRNRRLLRSNEERDEVMAFAAHDLRSPLLGLRNLIAYTLPRARAEPALAVEILAEAERSLDGTLTLIARLLAVHEAEYGPIDATSGGDLRLALTAAAERHRPLADSASVAMRLNLPDRPVPARYDESALERILDNLVANAVRFTPAGCGVTLRCRNDAGQAMLSVEDEGTGIAETERAHLFVKFRRGQNSPVLGPAGSGLGLFIVGMLTERIGGRITCRPAEPRGSIFEIALPRHD